MLWIVIPLAFVFAGLAIAAFMWTVRSGQMDDLDTPASRILFDDDESKVNRPTDKNSK